MFLIPNSLRPNPPPPFHPPPLFSRIQIYIQDYCDTCTFIGTKQLVSCVSVSSAGGPPRSARVSLSTRRQGGYLFYVPARQSDIPENVAPCPLNFSFPALIYFLSSWLPLLPRQFSHRKSAESAGAFHSELECQKASLAALRLSKYCKSLTFTSPPTSSSFSYCSSAGLASSPA